MQGEAYPSPPGGFTLLELLIVLAILSIVVLAVYPYGETFLQETRVNAAAAEVASAVEYARGLAVLYDRPFGMKADSTANSYCVYDTRYASTSNPPSGAVPRVGPYGVVRHPVDKMLYLRDFDLMAHYRQVKISRATDPGGFVFYPDGHTTFTGGSIQLQCGSSTRQVTIQGLTGVVAVN